MKKQKVTNKFFDCDNCVENLNGYCKLRMKDKEDDYSKCENIKFCDWYRGIK